jgi:hypothetical protein
MSAVSVLQALFFENISNDAELLEILDYFYQVNYNQ